MKVQQNCVSWWSEGCKDRECSGLSCQDTTEFPLYVSQMVLQRPSAVSRWHVCIYPSQIQEMQSFVFCRKPVLTAAVISNVSVDVLWYWLEALDMIQGTCQHISLFIRLYGERKRWLNLKSQVIMALFLSLPLELRVPISKSFSRIYIHIYLGGWGRPTVFPQCWTCWW